MPRPLLSPPDNYKIADPILFQAYIDRYSVKEEDLASHLAPKAEASLNQIGLTRLDDIGEPRLFIRGKLLKALLKKLCRQPVKDDRAERPLDSVGVGPLALAATDSYSAVVIGWPEPGQRYAPTSRRAAMLEAEREMIYCDGCALLETERLPTTDTVSYPNIHEVMKQVADMAAIGIFSPELLKRAAEIAIASNAYQIELLVGADQGKNLLAFKFNVQPDEDQYSLFGQTDSIPAQGLIVGRQRQDLVDDGEDGEDEEVPKPSGEAETAESDELWTKALDFVGRKRLASTSALQREFSIGFQRALRLLEAMEKHGVVGPHDGPRPREIIMEPDALAAFVHSQTKPLHEAVMDEVERRANAGELDTDDIKVRVRRSKGSG